MSTDQTEILRKSNTLHQHIEMNIHKIKEELVGLALKDKRLDKIGEEYKSFQDNIVKFLSLLKGPSKGPSKDLDISDELEKIKSIMERLKNAYNEFINENEDFDYKKERFLKILEEIIINIREVNTVVTKNYL